MANSYLTFTQAAGTSRRKFTYSVWMKRSTDNTSGSYNSGFFNCWSDANNRLAAYFYDNKLYLYGLSGGSANISVRTNRLFRDTSAWYHIVIAVDTTQSTASDRIKFYINGVQETSLDQTTYPAQDHDLPSVGVNAKAIEVGRVNFGDQSTYYYMDGYLSHVAFVDGSALAPTVFGQTDSTSGIWKFKSPSTSWGTNGFHLKFENSGNLGLDSSGQTNNFTVNGNLKQSISTPSNLYCTLNSTFNLSDNVLSLGGLKVVNSNSNWKYVPSTLGVESGKWYAEYKVTKGSGYIMNGVVDMNYATSQDKNSYTHSGAGTGSVSIYSDSGEKYIQGSNTSYAGTYTDNDIIGVALDMDNSKVYFSKNGAWANGSGGWGSSTFDAAVGAITLPTTGTYTFAVSQRSGAYNEVNFGEGRFGTTAISSAGSNGNGALFEYDVPSGFYALNTKNLNTYG